VTFSNWNPFKLFYGWWIVGAALLIGLFTGGAVFYGFTAIFEPIADDLGWSYTQISLAASLRGLEAGLIAPFVGVLVDRLGPRRLIFSGAIVAAAGLFLLSRVTSLGMFYVAFALMALGTSACSMTVLMTAIANWFQRKVGTASGIAISGYGFSGLLVPVIARLIEIYEWRTVVFILALGMIGIVIPLSFVFRHKPEQYGYLPDGEAQSAVKTDEKVQHLPTVEIKARQIIKNGTFWRLAIAFMFHIVLVTATTTHVMPYLSSFGIARSTSSIVASAIPLSSVGGRLSFGWLGDKFDRKRMAAIAFIMTSLGMLCFAYASTAGAWLLIPFIILFGIGYGGLSPLRPSLAREYFGRASFGTIFGFIIGVNMLGGIIGPPLAGWVYDTWGSYQGIWFAFTALPVVALVAVVTIQPFRKKDKPIVKTTNNLTT